MPPTVVQSSVVINVTLIPAADSSTSLGDLVMVVPQGAVAGGNVFTVNSAADVAALLSATNITAAGAEAINLALSQSPRPSVVRVVTYVLAALGTGLAFIDAQASWNPGVIMVFGFNGDAGDITDLGNYIDNHRWSSLFVTESDLAGLIGSGKPAALAELELDEVALFYVPDDTDGTSPGACFAARIAAKQLVGSGGGPAAARLRLQGADAVTLTSTELSNLLANDGLVTLQLDAGNSASERVVMGTKGYAGNGITPVVSMLFAVKSIRAAISGLILAKAIEGKPILSTASGVAEVEQVVIDRLQPMADAGHFVIDADYPLGYSVVGSVSGDEMTIDVYLRLPQEVRQFTFNVTGEIVS